MNSFKKFVAIAAIAVASITTASAQLSEAQTNMVRERVQNQVQVLDKQLKLNDGQRTNIREAILEYEMLTERTQVANANNTEDRRATMLKARADKDRRIKSILRQEQYTTYLQMENKRENRVQSSN